jgi:hypothetical protein
MPSTSSPTLSFPFNSKIFFLTTSKQLCDFGALKQQQQNLKQKQDAAANLQASGRVSASPLPGSHSPTRLRPRSQHGNGKAAPSSAHKTSPPRTGNASPFAQNSQSLSPLRLSSPNSPQGPVHKSYKVCRNSIPPRCLDVTAARQCLTHSAGSCGPTRGSRCWGRVTREHFARGSYCALRHGRRQSDSEQRHFQGRRQRRNREFTRGHVASRCPFGLG